jgi:EXLDI family protein
VMPNKMIYVSDKDLPLFERAQELTGGNLSAAIVKALKKLVELEEGNRAGYKEIIVSVGLGKGRKLRFSGMLLAEWMRANHESVQQYKVYATAKGKFAVHLERSPEYKTTGDWKAQYLGIGESTLSTTPGESTLDVYDTLEALREAVPIEIYTLVAGTAKYAALEDLDI